MKKLLITNDCTNVASRRVCEKLGARFLRAVRLPQWHPVYQEGQRLTNIFVWRNVFAWDVESDTESPDIAAKSK